MACPYFYPRERLGENGWPDAPRLPLVEFWSGECRAGEGGTPEADVLRECCNVGYARGRCGRFPQDAQADAVRFSAAPSGDGILRLRYVLERDHFPVRHGSPDDAPDILRRQAEAFAASFLEHTVSR